MWKSHFCNWGDFEESSSHEDPTCRVVINTILSASTMIYLSRRWVVVANDGNKKPVQELTIITVVLNESYSTGNVCMLGEFEESRYWDDLHCRVVLTTSLSASTMVNWSKCRVGMSTAPSRNPDISNYLYLCRVEPKTFAFWGILKKGAIFITCIAELC